MLALVVTLLAAADFPDRCPSPLLPGAALTEPGSVVAPSGGVVTAVGDVLSVRLCAYENHEVRDVTLEVRGPVRATALKVGDVVTAGQVLASGGSVVLDGAPPKRFFREHPFLYAPRAEPVLLVVDVEGHEARRYERGVRTHSFEVARGQAEGVKARRGDLKTPRGLYFVTTKSTGPFTGAFAGYYGGHWVKVSYPNAFDAQRGVETGLVTTEQAASITASWWRRGAPAQHTGLGGGIGFHGWKGPWRAEVEGYGLSWGCVVLHPEDVAVFYAAVPVGAAVVLE